MLSADAIVKLHDDSTAAWHAPPKAPKTPCTSDPWLGRVARQHRANFDLWHIEDEARAPGATDAQLADRQAPHRPNQPAPQRSCRGSGPHPARLACTAASACRRRRIALRVARPDHRPAFDSRAEDLSHPRRGRTYRLFARPYRTQPVAPRRSYRATYGPCPIASICCGARLWTAHGASSFTSSSRCTTTPHSTLPSTAARETSFISWVPRRSER